MPKVPSPMILYRDGLHPGMPLPIGPRNLVEELDVEPFAEVVGPELGKLWKGDQIFVLSLVTEDPRKSPQRFVLGREALEILADEVRSALGDGKE